MQNFWYQKRIHVLFIANKTASDFKSTKKLRLKSRLEIEFIPRCIPREDNHFLDRESSYEKLFYTYIMTVKASALELVSNFSCIISKNCPGRESNPWTSDSKAGTLPPSQLGWTKRISLPNIFVSSYVLAIWAPLNWIAVLHHQVKFLNELKNDPLRLPTPQKTTEGMLKEIFWSWGFDSFIKFLRNVQ